MDELTPFAPTKELTEELTVERFSCTNVLVGRISCTGASFASTTPTAESMDKLAVVRFSCTNAPFSFAQFSRTGDKPKLATAKLATAKFDNPPAKNEVDILAS